MDLSKKRGNGEGSIHRRKGGGWCAQYTVYTAKGRKRKTLYGKTRQEMATKLAKALSDQQGASPSMPETRLWANTWPGGSRIPSGIQCDRAPSRGTSRSSGST